MKKNNLRTKNQRKGQSYQQKVNSFAIYIAFLLLLLLLFLFFTGKGKPTGEIQTSTDDSQEETKGEKSKGTFICYNYRLQILTLTVITSTYRKETSTQKTEKT